MFCLYKLLAFASIFNLILIFTAIYCTGVLNESFSVFLLDVGENMIRRLTKE